MSFTWLAAALLAAQRLFYTLEYPRVSLSLSLSVTLPGERRVEGMGGESA